MNELCIWLKKPDNWLKTARTILTTDSRSKSGRNPSPWCQFWHNTAPGRSMLPEVIYTLIAIFTRINCHYQVERRVSTITTHCVTASNGVINRRGRSVWRDSRTKSTTRAMVNMPWQKKQKNRLSSEIWTRFQS